MPNCCVFSCKKISKTSNKQKDNITFHLFPKDTIIRNVWIRACANHVSWTPKRTSTICSAHFEASSFIVQSNNRRRLKQCAFPTLKLSKVDPLEQLEPERPLFKINFIEKQEDPLSILTQECKITEDQPCTSQSGIIKVEKQEDPLSILTRECKITEDQPCTSQSGIIKVEKQDDPLSILTRECKITEDQPCTSQSGIIKVERQEEPLSILTQECKTTSDQFCTSQSEINISKSPTLTHNLHLPDTLRVKKLKQILQIKNKQIKRLHSQNRYLKKKVAELKEILNELREEINKDGLDLNKIGVEEK